MNLNFEQVYRKSSGPLCFNQLETLQVNVGNRCNMECKHCHVQAGPDGDKIMQRDVMDKIATFAAKQNNLTIDITGGCPEMNPNFIYLADNAFNTCYRVIVRTNLTAFFEPGMEPVLEWYKNHNVTLVASLPCYGRENVENQRGKGAFDKSIEAMRMLNQIGYGGTEGMEIDLVYNPDGPALPPPQKELEQVYKTQLLEKYGIVFNNLFCITNSPIGRFRKSLEKKNQLDDYYALLADNFNLTAGENLMCRSLISVDYRGIVYNCDFNQAMDMTIVDSEGLRFTIDRIDELLKTDVKIAAGIHCFACTAGQGSSCRGKTA